MVQQIFNPGPSSLRTARMLSYRVPRPQTAFPGPKPPGHLSLGIPRIGKQGGGGIPDSPNQPFTGAIHSPGAGRSDDVPMHVPQGAYVLPADVIGHMGQGNTLNGLKVAGLMFGPKPFGANAGPWGVPLGKPTMGPGVPMPHARPPRPIGATGMPTATPAAPAPMMGGRQAHGGGVDTGAPATPIAASGGEFVIPPAEVKRRGGGDISKGHRILDAFVKSVRADHIKTLQKLPGPAQN